MGDGVQRGEPSNENDQPSRSPAGHLNSSRFTGSTARKRRRFSPGCRSRRRQRLVDCGANHPIEPSNPVKGFRCETRQKSRRLGRPPKVLKTFATPRVDLSDSERSLASDRWGIVDQEVSRSANGVVGIADLSRRRSRRERTTVQGFGCIMTEQPGLQMRAVVESALLPA